MDEPEVKTKLLRGAEELFMRYGVRSITMDEIARHLSISKKTLYQYFADKDDIVASVTYGHLNREKKQYEANTNAARNAVEELVKLSLCLKENLKGMNPSLLFDLQKYHQNAWRIWTEFKNVFIRESVVSNLKRGIAEGLYRPEIDPEIMAVLRIETVQLGFDERLFPRDKYDLASLQLAILEHFIHGLLTEKGRRLYQKYKKETVNEPSYYKV
jgi:AcrR family transcriptional regulator